LSDLPERSILKEILKKLKAKTLTSETRLINSNTDVYNKIADVWKEFKELIDERQIGTDAYQRIALVLRELHLLVDILTNYSTTTLEDFSLYTDALEQYSSELDKTLTDIFEQAKKLAEEQQKKQEELRKRKAPESYRV